MRLLKEICIKLKKGDEPGNKEKVNSMPLVFPKQSQLWGWKELENENGVP